MHLHLLLCVGLVFCTIAPPVGAQCTSNASSCFDCHETRATRPVLGDASPWHRDHAFGDLCASCHGGQPQVPEQALAHQTLRDPMGESERACVNCHEDDRDSKLLAYLAANGADDGPGPSPRSGLVADPVAPRSVAHEPSSNRAATVLAAALAVLLGGLVQKRLSRPGLVRAWLTAKLWSPYIAGALVGVVVAVCEVFLSRPLGVSGAFDKLAAYLGRWWLPHSQYYQYAMTPAITWQVWLVIGVLIGAWAASKVARGVSARWLPDSEWRERFGPKRLKRLVIAFGGAVLVQFGADVAGGCTSGLAISGGAVLSPSAFLFMAGMFALGIPTAWLWDRVGRER